MTRRLRALRTLRSASVQRPGRALAAALFAVLALVITLAPRQVSANPANVYVINENVATALNGGTPVDLTTVAGRAASGVVSNLAAFDTASAGQVANDHTHSGQVVILVRTDGSPTNLSLNGRGLSCTPACDGVTNVAPGADGYVAYGVTGSGTRSIGDSFAATAVQDSVALDSPAIKVVGPANNFQVATPKSTIQEGATSCGAADNVTDPTKAAFFGYYTDIDGQQLVGYATTFSPAWASGSTGVAAGTSVSMLQPDGTTTAAADVVCGGVAGTSTIITASTAVGAISGVSGVVSRTQDFTVTGVPATIALTASPAAIECDGASTSTVTAKVTDSAGNNVVDGTPVTFSVVALGTSNPINTTTAGGDATSVITPLSGGTSGVVVTVTSGAAASSIRIDCLPQSGDSFAGPVNITNLPFTNALSTTGFTTETGEPLPCGAMGATAWYELSLPGSPPVNQPLSAQTAGSNFNTAIAIYVLPPSALSGPGATFSELTNLGCAATGATSSVSFTAPRRNLFRAGRRRRRRDGESRLQRPVYRRRGLRRPERRRRGDPPHGSEQR